MKNKMIPVHNKPPFSFSYDRLEQLWSSHPRYRELTTFTTLEDLLKEHQSYLDDFEKLQDEYVSNHYEKFLIQLGWSDLPYRMATRKMIETTGMPENNEYIERFMYQFLELDTDHNACFLFPESYVSQFFVIMEVCKKAKALYPINNIFPDETKVHYLAVFDKDDMDDILLMYHLLSTNASEEVFGGYSLYDYSLPWYQNHLWKDGVVMRSPFLPDRIARYQGNLPFYHNPSKTVYVRRNIEHLIQKGYVSSELELFMYLTTKIMPVFQWWYEDVSMYEKSDGFKTNWRLRRTEIRTELTADGIIKPKWKHELSLFYAVRDKYPDTLYQYRPDWLGRQSIDIYIPSIRTAIEYQGIQHYQPVDFFGGYESLQQRQTLDVTKQKLCKENNVKLIIWPYQLEPAKENLKKMI